MILDLLGPFAVVVLLVPPAAGALRAFALDRFGDGLGTTVWRIGAATMAGACLLFATSYGLPGLADLLVDAASRSRLDAVRLVYKIGFLAVYGATVLLPAVAVDRRARRAGGDARVAAVSIVLAVLLFLVVLYPVASVQHCPALTEGLPLAERCPVDPVGRDL